MRVGQGYERLWCDSNCDVATAIDVFSVMASMCRCFAVCVCVCVCGRGCGCGWVGGTVGRESGRKKNTCKQLISHAKSWQDKKVLGTLRRAKKRDCRADGFGAALCALRCRSLDALLALTRHRSLVRCPASCLWSLSVVVTSHFIVIHRCMSAWSLLLSRAYLYPWRRASSPFHLRLFYSCVACCLLLSMARCFTMWPQTSALGQAWPPAGERQLQLLHPLQSSLSPHA
jgi:hypothetical protein